MVCLFALTAGICSSGRCCRCWGLLHVRQEQGGGQGARIWWVLVVSLWWFWVLHMRRVLAVVGGSGPRWVVWWWPRWDVHHLPVGRAALQGDGVLMIIWVVGGAGAVVGRWRWNLAGDEAAGAVIPLDRPPGPDRFAVVGQGAGHGDARLGQVASRSVVPSWMPLASIHTRFRPSAAGVVQLHRGARMRPRSVARTTQVGPRWPGWGMRSRRSWRWPTR